MANFLLDAELEISSPHLKDNTIVTLQIKAFEKSSTFLIPGPATAGLVFKDITEF